MKDYYTVTEYAKIYGKDVGNVRRMLINGAIRGEKLGKQWAIPKDEIYPKDGRIKSGNYKNWRKRMSICHDEPKIMSALNEMSSDLSKIYGNSLERVILYGSYARGEQSRESDIDIALLIKGEDNERMHDEMLNIVVDYELELEVTLSVVPIEYENYMEWNKTLPFYKNIDKEGIVLWKTA